MHEWMKKYNVSINVLFSAAVLLQMMNERYPGLLSK